MRFTKLHLLCAGGALLATILAACGSGSGPAAPSNIRLVNLISGNSSNSYSDTMWLTLNSTAYGTDATPQSAGGYIQVTPGTYEGSVFLNSLTDAAPDTFPGLALGTTQYFSLVVYPRDGVLYPFELIDNVSDPAAFFANFSIANASPDAGPLDIYITNHTATSPADPCTANLVAGSATFPGVQSGQVGPIQYEAYTSNNVLIPYDVCVTANNNPSDARLSISGLTFNQYNEQVYTLVLTSSNGGTLVNSSMVGQGTTGYVQQYSNSNIRVRVMTSLPGLSGIAPVVTVTSSSASTTLPNVISGQFSAYQTVSLGSGQPTVAVTVSGTTAPVSLPSGFSFAAGGDYTILVYNTPALGATVLADNNHYLPQAASVRLVNAADTSTNLSMTINHEALGLAQNVAIDTTSGYNSVISGSDVIILNSQNATPVSPVGTAQTWSLQTGGVYTIFVYDLTQPWTLIEDR